MRAVVTEAPGGWDHTRLADVSPPVAGDSEVLVDIRAASVNPADRHLIEGRYPGGPLPPFIAGRDAAGVVVQADADARFPVGTKVLVLQSTALNRAHGTFCERQRVPAESVDTVPPGWSWTEAAAAPLVFQTAWQALSCHGLLEQGQVLAVTGAGGGVGLAAVQLALALGATVVALSSSAGKHQRLKSLGAHCVFSPDTPDLKRKISEAIGQRGLDVVVDTVGGSMLGTAVHLLGPNGYVAALGVLGGVEGNIPIPALMFKQASIHGVLVSGGSPAEARAQWRRIVEVLQRSGRRPVVARCFPLEQYCEAFCYLAGSPYGKVLLEINSG